MKYPLIKIKTLRGKGKDKRNLFLDASYFNDNSLDNCLQSLEFKTLKNTNANYLNDKAFPKSKTRNCLRLASSTYEEIVRVANSTNVGQKFQCSRKSSDNYNQCILVIWPVKKICCSNVHLILNSYIVIYFMKLLIQMLFPYADITW